MEMWQYMGRSHSLVLQGGTKAVEIVMSRLLMSAVADVSHRVRQTVLSALIETEDLDTYLAQAEWCAYISPPCLKNHNSPCIVLTFKRGSILKRMKLESMLG